MGEEIINSFYMQLALKTAIYRDVRDGHQYLTPEQLLISILTLHPCTLALKEMNINQKEMLEPLFDYVNSQKKRYLKL